MSLIILICCWYAWLVGDRFGVGSNVLTCFYLYLAA